MMIYHLELESRIYSDYRQNKHGGSFQLGKDPYQ